MDANNLVLLRGTITSEPTERRLASGDLVTQVELSTRVGGRSTSVPVAVHGTQVTLRAGDDVVVTGHVSRRFFRVGGATQSRTEVIALDLVRSTRKRGVARAIESVIAQAQLALE